MTSHDNMNNDCVHPRQQKVIHQVYNIDGRKVSYWTAKRMRLRKCKNYILKKRAQIAAEKEQKAAHAKAREELAHHLSDLQTHPYQRRMMSPPTPQYDLPTSPLLAESIPNSEDDMNEMLPESSYESDHSDEDMMLMRTQHVNVEDAMTSALEYVDIVEYQKRKIQSIFVKYGLVRNCKDELLQCMKELKKQTQDSLPKSSTSLHLPLLKYTVYDVRPGQVAYFGVNNILNASAIDLFDPKSNTVSLTLNIDGLPLFRSSKIGFWPILGKIGNKSVFLIGLYSGIKKPICSNEFIKPLVNELCSIRKNGITIRGKTYRFLLSSIIMDAPARAYILGVKGHTAKTTCNKCRVVGVQVRREGLASTKMQCASGRKALCYLDMHAERRTAADFNDPSIPYCNTDPANHCQHSGTYCWDDVSMCNNNSSTDTDTDTEEEDEDSTQIPIADRKASYFRHRTLLSTIPGFDVVRDVPLDYLHLICEGITKKLIHIWNDNSQCGMNKNRVEDLLKNAKKYCPREFQRTSGLLDDLNLWKASQFRSFALYTSVAVLDGNLDSVFFKNFIHYVVALRGMCKKVPYDLNRPQTLQFISENADILLRRFLKVALELYGPEFACHNVHCLLHLHEDYFNFGELDSFSAFPFESFLGHLKKYVHGSKNPLKQVVRVLSDRLGLAEFGIEKESWDHVSEFYEEPILKFQNHSSSVSDDEEDEEDDFLFDNDSYEEYSHMQFRNFVLRTDNKQDRFCAMSTVNGICYVKVKKIIQQNNTKEIFIVGKYFEDVHSFFTLPCPSQEVGIVKCSQPTTRNHMFPTSQLKNKCFAFPISDSSDGSITWAITEYLH